MEGEMDDRATRKSTGAPQLGDPALTAGSDNGRAHLRLAGGRAVKGGAEKKAPPTAPDVDRPGQGDDDADRQNQADGHHDTPTGGGGSRDRLTKSGRLNVREIKKALEKSDKPPR
jgi:hypothetical protein